MPDLERDLDQSSRTCFSTLDFAEAWVRSFQDGHRTFAIPVKDSGPPRTMYAVKQLSSYGRQSISLSPYGLYASPGWQGQLYHSTLNGIIGCLTGFRTNSFTWNVRFDHEQLAAGLISAGFTFSRIPTRVIDLTTGYEKAFAGYNATIRNHVRRSSRAGVSVMEAASPEVVAEYYQIYIRATEQRGGYQFIYPFELFLALAENREMVRLLVAEFEGRIIGGGLFFRDGKSVLYWHGASDRDFSRCYPSCAVLDQAIKWAAESDATYFNFGGSAGIPSLDRFKSFWGARTELNWEFIWKNPFWKGLSNLKARLRRNDAG